MYAIAILLALVGYAAGGLTSAGEVLGVYDEWSSEDLGGNIGIAWGKVQLSVAYDGTGPYVSVNVSMAGDGLPRGGRYELGVRHDLTGDHITYKGDAGYCLCCRFLHGSTCSWEASVLTPEDCPTSPFVGSVTKPLPHPTPGPWTAAVAVYGPPPELSPLVVVQVHFPITYETSEYMNELMRTWRKRGTMLPVVREKEKEE